MERHVGCWLLWALAATRQAAVCAKALAIVAAMSPATVAAILLATVAATLLANPDSGGRVAEATAWPALCC